MKSLEEIFRANLIRLRGPRTQAAIAELAGIPLRSYQNVEVNGSIPQGPNRRAIANALGVPESHLFVDPHEFVPVDVVDPITALAIVANALHEARRRPTPAPPSTEMVQGAIFDTMPEAERIAAVVRASPIAGELIMDIVKEFERSSKREKKRRDEPA